MNTSVCLVVLGMHRSGTSALTGALSLLGIHVGDAVIPATEANPRGFWEHAGIVNLHERLLASLGSSWHDERSLPKQWWRYPEVKQFRNELFEILVSDFGSQKMWVVKDPRMCRLFPLWRPVLKKIGCAVRVILILRDPREVVKSVARRDGITEERSYLLWLRYVAEAEEWTRGYARTLITFEELLEDWQAAIQRIGMELSLYLPDDEPTVQIQMTDFLAPALRHHTASDHMTSNLSCLAAAAYETCAKSLSPQQIPVALSRMLTEVEQLSTLIAPWSSEIQTLWHTRSELSRRVAICDKTLAALNDELVRVKGTWSWRITAPLRVACNLYRSLIGK